MAKYRVLVGIDWYGGKRAEPGDIREDIPPKSTGWLLAQGVIEKYETPKGKAAKGKSGGNPPADTPTEPPDGADGQESTTEAAGENADGDMVAAEAGQEV